MCLQFSVLYHAQSNNVEFAAWMASNVEFAAWMANNVEFALWMGNMAKLQVWSRLRAFCSNKYPANFQILIPNMTTSL